MTRREELEPCDHHGDGPCPVHGSFPWNLGCPVVAGAELRAAREAAAESGLREALREWLSLHAVRQGKLAAGSTVIDAEELDDFLEAFATPPAPSNHGADGGVWVTETALVAALWGLNTDPPDAQRVARELMRRLTAPSVPPEEPRP